VELPKVGTSYIHERRGIAAIQAYAASRKQIWRETGTGDVGIDGQLEFVNSNGFATGRTLAVQVKAGPSFFRHESATGWKFYPEAKHRNYWEQFPLPVLLILHNTDTGVTFWTDARQALRTPSREERAYIEMPEANVLETTDPIALFEHAGVQDKAFIPEIAGVLNQLLAISSEEGTFPLSYFDLFVHGLTNICRTIYYGMDLICSAVEYNLAAQDSEFGMGMGHDEHQFAFGFVKFLVAQSLAHIDYADCLIDWVAREMHPHFVAPLTSRGRAVVALIHEEEQRLVASGALPDQGLLRVAQEGFFQMVPESHCRRFPRIRAFQAAIKTTVT
jgi:Domain of unknown function (DUF4365)